VLARILALLLKEFAALWHDHKTRAVLIFPPLAQVIIFAHAATYDVSRVPLAVWNEDRGTQAAELVRRFDGSDAFQITADIASLGQAQAAIDAKDVAAVLHVPQDFSADLLAEKRAPVQLLLDARRSNTALLIQGYAASIVATYSAEVAGGRVPIEVRTRDWFNATLESQWFILPGLVAVLSAMMGMLVAALSLARERELGTFEQLLVTPLRPQEILIGKAAPAVVVGLINANIVMAASVLWFGVPLLGSVWLLEAMLGLYMFAGVGIGLVISSLSHTQQQAMLGVFVMASPMVMLSGYAAPVENMPHVMEIIGRADPIRWMLIIARGIFLQDMPAGIALHAAWPMLAICAVTFGAAWVAVRRAVT
jgi:ABC-2 type transport system permease protein